MSDTDQQPIARIPIPDTYEVPEFDPVAQSSGSTYVFVIE